MKFEEYKNPVLIGGAIGGFLSIVPIISIFNFFCCLWILVGAGIAIYLANKNMERTLNYGEGALIGLMSGLVAAVINSVINTIFMIAGYDMVVQMMETFAEKFPQLEQFTGMFAERTFGVAMVVVSFLSNLFWFGGFGALGGVIGIALFVKKKGTMPTP